MKKWSWWAAKADKDPRPRTRADVIRAMDDADLAAVASTFFACAFCPISPECHGNVERCDAAWREYLMEEVP